MPHTLPDLVELAKRLDGFVKRFESGKKVMDNSWFIIWLGMVGCCYALQLSQDLLGEPDNNGRKERQAREILQSIMRKKSPTIKNKSSWHLGYCLNNAESRISWEFHRLLKAYLQRDDGNAFNLVGLILLSWPSNLGTSFSDRTKEVLQKFKDYDPERDRACKDKAIGAALRRVWWRVNSLKHDRGHRSQIIASSRLRCDDGLSALGELSDVFETFATEKKGIRL